MAKQGAIFKDICLKQCTFSDCSSRDLTYYEPANWLFRRQIPCPNYFLIIIYYKVFLYFFPNQLFQKVVLFLRSGVRNSGGI